MTIRKRIEAIRQRINVALEQAGRKDEVTLVAVGKTHPPEVLLQAYLAKRRLPSNKRWVIAILPGISSDRFRPTKRAPSLRAFTGSTAWIG
jgi:hypothetical protein